MLAKGFPEKIGFTKEECATYRALIEKVQDKIEPCAKAYMNKELALYEALEQVHQLENESLHVYTLDLLLLLECTGYLEEIYREKGRSEESFVETMKDFKYKLDECVEVKGVFGVFAAGWYDLYFQGDLIALGRLQYRTMTYDGETVTLQGKTIAKGDRVVDCHIPSSGPMTRELVLDSYKKAYDMYSEYRVDGVLPIRCNSWLLYPPYESLFSVSKNITDFRNDFTVVSQSKDETFGDAWRVFGTDSCDIETLPETTSLQRAFKAHMKEGGTFGNGMGFVLFDGEKVLTEK